MIRKDGRVGTVLIFISDTVFPYYSVIRNSTAPASLYD